MTDQPNMVVDYVRNGKIELTLPFFDRGFAEIGVPMYGVGRPITQPLGPISGGWKPK